MTDHRDPSPLIDMIAVERLARQRNEPIRAVLEKILDGRVQCVACYRSLDELEAAQRCFLDNVAISIIKKPAAVPRRNLLFIQAGRRFSMPPPPLARIGTFV